MSWHCKSIFKHNIILQHCCYWCCQELEGLVLFHLHSVCVCVCVHVCVRVCVRHATCRMPTQPRARVDGQQLKLTRLDCATFNRGLCEGRRSESDYFRVGGRILLGTARHGTARHGRGGHDALALCANDILHTMSWLAPSLPSSPGQGQSCRLLW